MKSQLKKLMTGLAGEYLVAGIMSLKGWTASMTLKNYPGVDIFGLNNETGQTASIQVKSCWDNSFFIGVRRSEREQMKDKIKGPFVFVHCEKDSFGRKSASFYILSKDEFITLVNKSDIMARTRERLKKITPSHFH